MITPGKLTFVALLLLAVLLGIGALFHMAAKDDEAHIQREQEWRVFSVQHHCYVSTPETFWSVTTTWNCEGFQIQRHPND